MTRLWAREDHHHEAERPPLLRRDQRLARLLLRKDRQAHEQQLHAGVGAQREFLAAGERRVLTKRLAINRALAPQHETDLNAPARGLQSVRARLELEDRELQVALGEDAQALSRKARLLA